MHPHMHVMHPCADADNRCSLFFFFFLFLLKQYLKICYKWAFFGRWRFLASLHFPTALILDYFSECVTCGTSSCTPFYTQVITIKWWRPIDSEDRNFSKGTLWRKILISWNTCLGFGVAHGEKGVVLLKENMFDLLQERWTLEAKPTTLLMNLHAHLSDDQAETINFWSYTRSIGKFLYVTITRTDISFAMQRLRQYIMKPKKLHSEAVMTLIRYISQKMEYGSRKIHLLRLKHIVMQIMLDPR